MDVDELCRVIDGELIAHRFPARASAQVVVSRRGNVYLLLKPTVDEWSILGTTAGQAAGLAMSLMRAAFFALMARRRWRRVNQLKASPARPV